MQQSILVVEDNADVRQLTVEALTDEGGFAVSATDCIARARSMMAEQGSFDLLVLDVGLPDGDGREFCAGLRRSGSHIPIILLSGLADEQDIIKGLRAGADDYLVKPFGIAELLARIGAQLRQPNRRGDVRLPSQDVAA